MKTLMLLRHAKSSWKDEGLADHDRPLNERGKRDAPRLGLVLKNEHRLPDLILTSTAERACRTTELVAGASGYTGAIVRVDDLYAADAKRLLEVARARGSQAGRLLLVAHNPGLEELVEQLTGRSETMPTAALAEIVLPIDQWSELDEGTKGDLVSVWHAR